MAQESGYPRRKGDEAPPDVGMGPELSPLSVPEPSAEERAAMAQDADLFSEPLEAPDLNDQTPAALDENVELAAPDAAQDEPFEALAIPQPSGDDEALIDLTTASPDDFMDDVVTPERPEPESLLEPELETPRPDADDVPEIPDAPADTEDVEPLSVPEPERTGDDAPGALEAPPQSEEVSIPTEQSTGEPGDAPDASPLDTPQPGPDDVAAMPMGERRHHATPAQGSGTASAGGGDVAQGIAEIKIKLESMEVLLHQIAANGVMNREGGMRFTE